MSTLREACTAMMKGKGSRMLIKVALLHSFSYVYEVLVLLEGILS